MKHYRRMVGTPAYYRVCEDCLRDVSEIFGSPRLIHIGCDEEDGVWHVMQSKKRQYVVVRRGEVWKHDFLHLVRTKSENIDIFFAIASKIIIKGSYIK